MDVVWHYLVNLKGEDGRLTFFPGFKNSGALYLLFPTQMLGKKEYFPLFATAKPAFILTLTWTPLYQVYSQQS